MITIIAWSVSIPTLTHLFTFYNIYSSVSMANGHVARDRLLIFEMCDLQLCSAHFSVIQQNDFPFFFIELLEDERKKKYIFFLFQSFGIFMRIMYSTSSHYSLPIHKHFFCSNHETLTNWHETLSLVFVFGLCFRSFHFASSFGLDFCINEFDGFVSYFTTDF